jgi:hypothetical protein
MTRKSYPRDVSDDEWDFMMPYLTLMTFEGSQRTICAKSLMLCAIWCEPAEATAENATVPANLSPVTIACNLCGVFNER